MDAHSPQLAFYLAQKAKKDLDSVAMHAMLFLTTHGIEMVTRWQKHIA